MPVLVLTFIDRLVARLRQLREQEDREGGFATMELLAISGLSLIALIVIFAAIQALGVDIVGWMRDKIIGP